MTIEVDVETAALIEVELEEAPVIEVDIVSSGGAVDTISTESLLTNPQGGDVTPGLALSYVRIPARFTGWNLTLVAASLSTASGAGATTVQVRRIRAGVSVDMLTALITVEMNETDSTTAATQPVIDAGAAEVLTADQIAFDVVSAGAGAKGLLVEIRLQAP